MRKKIKNKKGAASFYIVAFSTLIMVIIAASFAAIIISEVTRTSNDDLAQSAYDSALAGVEDAKLAFYNYQSCQGATPTQPDLSVNGVTCGEIVYWMEEKQDCDTVGHILGRVGKGESGEVMIQESRESGNNMQQAYTCVKVSDTLDDYRGTLSNSNQSRVVRTRFDTENGVHASDVKSMKISWYSDANSSASGANYRSFKYSAGDDEGVVSFPSVGVTGLVPTPPILSVGLVQTAENFVLEDFDVAKDGRTNRGTVFLVPAGSSDEYDAEIISNKLKDDYNVKKSTYISAFNGSDNVISASGVTKTNDKVRENLPYVVYCDEMSDFACSATIQLPEPIGGNRNDDMFVVVVSLPYGKPNTDFSLEFYCDADRSQPCGGFTTTYDDEGNPDPEGERNDRASLRWVQIGVDSTGRANDLYRRVETRLEGANAFSLSSLGVLEILGSGGSNSIWKNFSVSCEYDFADSPTCSD